MVKKQLFTTTLAASLLLSGFSGIASAQSHENVSQPTEQLTTTVAQIDTMSYEEMYNLFNLSELFFDEKDYSVTAVSPTQFIIKISIDSIVKSYEDDINLYGEGKDEFLANVNEIRSLFGNSIEMRFTKHSRGTQKEVKIGNAWTKLGAEDEAIFLNAISRGGELERSGGYFLDTLNHWAEVYIQYLYQLNIVNGQTSLAFNPNGQITRAQLAVMIFRAADLSVEEDFETYAPYNDIKNNWAAKEISALYDYGLLDVFQGGNFNPNKPATREEVAAITYGLMSLYGVGFDAGYDIYFKDASSMNSSALEGIAFLQQEGIISGYKDGTFKPKANVTRAQFAKILTLASFKLEEYYYDTELE